MFKLTIHALLAGQFVCPYRYPASYEYLDDSSQRADVSNLVESLGYRLSRLGDEGAFFLARTEIDADGRVAIRKQFKEIKQEHWPRMQFLMTAQHALDNELLLSPGSLIDLPGLTDKISSSPKLMDDYRTVLPYLNGARVSPGLHDNLKRTLDGMCSDGYLIVKNTEREIYMMTGKIDYLHQLIAYLLDHEPMIERIEPSTQLNIEDGQDKNGGGAVLEALDLAAPDQEQGGEQGI
jgi:hypothetical protein